MSLYNDIKVNNKKKNSINAKTLIKNQKILNLTMLVIFATLLLTDLLYIIKENVLGITSFTNLLMIIAISLEAFIFIIHLLLSFNTENKTLRYLTVGIFSIPLVAYFGMMGYGDVFTIVIFILRLILMITIVMVVIRNNSKENKAFKLKQIVGFSFSFVILFSVIVVIITNSKRTVSYSYDDSLGGYVVNNVLDGSSEIEFKDNTVKINDYALKDAGDCITIPEGVKYVSALAFKESGVKEVHIESKDISIIEALNNSNIEKVYLDTSDVRINDLELKDRSLLRFYCNKEDVDNYRRLNSQYDYLFVPKTDIGEYFIAFNNTSLPIQYANAGDLLYEPTNISTEYKGKVKFKEWFYTYTDALGRIKKPIFPISVDKDIELNAFWSFVYTIKIDYNGGYLVDPDYNFDNLPEEIEVTKEDGNLNLPILEKVGYRFDGWYNIKDNLIFENNIIYAKDLKDMAISAKFSKIYVLDYELNGGELSPEDMDQEYVDGDIITPATPIRLGYDFMGWYDNPSFSGDSIDKVYDLGTKLYAKWRLKAPTITLSNNVSKVYDGEASTISVDVIHPLMESSDYSLSIKWYRNNETKAISTKNSYRIIDAENNRYYCHITISYLDDVYELDSDYINVNIEKAEYDMSDILTNFAGNRFEYEFSGVDQMPKIATLPLGIDKISLFAKYSYEGNFLNVGDTGKVIVNFETDSLNYNVPKEIEATVLIVQRRLTVTWDSLEHVYDGSNWKPNATLIGVVPGYPVSLKFLNSVQSINVDHYSINIGIDDVENYIFDDETVEYDIIPADYTNEEFEILNDTFEYNGQNHLVELSLPSGLLIDKEKSIPAKYVSDKTVTIYFKLENGITNFKAPDARTYNIDIKPLAITYKMDSSEFIYNGNHQAPTVTLNGVIIGDIVTANVIDNNTINADTYKLNVELGGKDSNNYTLIDNGNYYVITKADYDLSNIQYEKEFEYSGDIILPIPSNLPEGLEFDELNSIGLKDVCTNGKVIFAFKNNSKNYNDYSKCEGIININPKTISAKTINNKFTYTGLLQIPTVELIGLVSGDDIDYVVTNNDSIAVGRYVANVEITGSSISNYKYVSDVSLLEYEIEKADFDYKYEFSADTYVTYDGNPQKPYLDISGGTKKYYNGNLIEYEFNKEPINQGDYVITITFTINDNYNPQTLECNLHIARRELELEFETLIFEHQDTAVDPTITKINNLIDKDKNNVFVNVYNDETSTGTHKLNILLSGSASNNYVINKDYYIVIDEEVRELSSEDYIITPYDGTYDGLYHTVDVWLSPSISDEIDYIIDREAKDEGEYIVYVSFESKITGVIISTVVQSTINIKPKPVEVTFIDTNLIYNGSVQIPEYNISGVIGNDIVNVITANGFEPIDADEYNNINASLDNHNYVISGSNTLSFVIQPCEVRVEWESLDLTYNKNALKPKAIVYLDDERLYVDVNVTTDSSNISVGTYSATASINNKNYVILNNRTVNYNIIPMPLKLNWVETAFTYTGKVLKPEATVSPIYGDNCSVNVAVDRESKYPGTYLATANLDNNNYSILGSESINFEIGKGIITLDDLPSINPITEFVYDGLPHIPYVDSESKVVSDGSEIKYRATGKVEAGSWYVDLEFYVEGGNYNSIIVSKSIVISKRVINISLSETQFKYDNRVLKPTVYCSNIVLDEDISVIVNNNSISVGKYILNSSNLEIVGQKASNYKIEGEYEYNIIKGDLDISGISFSNTNVIYNGNSQLPTPVFPANLDNVIIDLDNSIGVTNVNDTKATIRFALTGSKANNYNIPADLVVDMKVSPKQLSINWTKLEFGYDGLKHTPKYNLLGVYENDIVNILFNNDGEANRGEYLIKALSVDNQNYVIDEETIEYVILVGKYDMSGVEIVDITFTYDGKSHKSIAVDSNMLPSGVTASISYELNDSVIYVGNHKATIKFSGDTINYLPIEDMYAYVHIVPKPITVSWSNITLTYNGYLQNPTATISNGVIGSDIVEIGVTGAQKNVGTYLATANLSNSNYVADSQTQSVSFTINPKQIDVNITIGSEGGTNFTFTYDGKIHDNISVEIDQADLCNNDSAFDFTITNNISSLVGTYSFTLVSGNPNYVPKTSSGTVTIEKLYINNWGQSKPTAHDGTATSLPYITTIINGEEVRLDTLGTDEYPFIYHYYGMNSWGGKTSEVTGDIPTGRYYIELECGYSGISIGYYGNIIVNYVNPAIKWSADGNYNINSSVFNIAGNYRNTAATFTYDSKAYSFTKALKLESGQDSYINFTLESTKTLVLFMNSGTTIKINGQTKAYTAGEPFVIELSEGTYSITKGSGSTLVYAAFLE